MVGVNAVLYRDEAVESAHDRSYWAAKPWAGDIEPSELRFAQLLVVPWENFREGKPALFPDGTTEFIRFLTQELDQPPKLAISRGVYEEIALHADEWRLSTLVCIYIVLPIVTNVIASYIDQHISNQYSVETVEMEMIVEGAHGRCVSIRYKGPRSEVATKILDRADACFRAFDHRDEKIQDIGEE